MSHFNENKKWFVIGGIVLLLVAIFILFSGNEHKEVDNIVSLDEVSVSSSASQKENNTSDVKEEVKTPFVPTWDVDTGEGKDAYVSIEKMSDNLIQAWIKQIRPRLIIECREKTTTVFIDIGTSFTLVDENLDKAAVTYSIDKKKPVSGFWQKSGSGKAVIVPKPIEFLKALQKAKSFIFEFTPFNAKMVDAEFDLNGLEAQLEKVSESCGWKL